MGQSEMMVAYCVSDCSSISCVSRVVRIVIRIVHWLSRTLFSSNCGNVVENHTCHNNVTCPFWGDPEPTKALEPGLEHPSGHLYPGSCPAVSQVITLLRAGLRIRVRGQQIGLAGVPSVTEQVTIELSYDNTRIQFKFSVAIGGNKILIIIGYSYIYKLTTGKSSAQCTLTKHSRVMHRPRPLCFHVADDVGCITYDLHSAEQ